MFGRTTSCILGLAIVMLAAIAADARAQTPGSNSKVITWKPASNSSENYVGILGEIAKPRVYKVNSQALNLQSIIRIAGGMTDDASGTIRVVRQDRVVESIYFTPQANLPLLAGDLLIVESKRIQAAFSRLYETDPHARAKYAQADEGAVKGNDAGGVQLAFVNVLDRPVIVKVKHEHATLAQVVQKLDQPFELAQSVRVIGPERVLSQGAMAQPIDTAIADGSVLVFPVSGVNRNKLPSLPIPYDSEIATGAIPSLIGGPTGQSPELRNVGQLPPLAARDIQYAAPISRMPANLEQATTPLPPAIETQAPAATERLEIPAPSPSLQMPVLSSSPRIATIPFTGESRIKSSSSRSQITSTTDEALRSNDAAEPAEKLEPKKPKSSDMNLEDDPFEDKLPEEPTSAKKETFSAGHLVGLLACIGVLIGVALLTRRFLNGSAIEAPAESSSSLAMETPSQSSTDAQPLVSAEQMPEEEHLSTETMEATAIAPMPQQSATALTKTWFDQLLGNQLPLREEAAEFPQRIELQGRIIPPPVYRVDPPAARQLGQGPHFSLQVPAKQPAPQTASSVDVGIEQVIDEFDAPHNSRPAKPHFLKRRPGENTIAAAAALKVNSSVTPEAKTSTTPLTDALRQLQGDQT